MTRRLACLFLLTLMGCPSEEAAGPTLPDKPAKRQLDLANRIFNAVPDLEKLGPDAEQDAGLVLAQVVVPGYAARLRLFVAEDHPGVAKGAAIALVKIRTFGKAESKPILEECIKNETIQAMQTECTRRLQVQVASGKDASAGVKELLDASDPEVRRKALRRLLDPDQEPKPISEELTGRLLRLLNDSDLRVKMLAEGVFLRDSLVRNPLPPEPQ